MNIDNENINSLYSLQNNKNQETNMNYEIKELY